MKTATQKKMNATWAKGARPMGYASADWREHRDAGDFPVLSEANVSEVFHRAKALQRERDWRRPALVGGLLSESFEQVRLPSAHTRFFQWALHKIS